MKQLLPIAIMAHNEEEGITTAVESALNQEVPPGFFAKVLVVANACTDGTEEVVRRLANRYPNRVDLLIERHKGKTKAIKAAIQYLQAMTLQGTDVSYVVFLDADCQFLGSDVLLKFMHRFDANPLLCAVSASPKPDVCFNSRNDLVSKVYRATYSLSKIVKVNSISGMCYAIRFDILTQIKFPDAQLNEDMYVASRLNGRFIRDYDIKVIFKPPNNMIGEINRRTRQEIYTQRYKNHYSYLVTQGEEVKIFRQPIAQQYCWGNIDNRKLLTAWLSLNPPKWKFYSAIYLLFRMIAILSAYKKIRRLEKDESLDYWRVTR